MHACCAVHQSYMCVYVCMYGICAASPHPKALTLRLHAFLHAGRRVLVVGDLNIAPFVVDRAEGDALGLLRRDRAWLHSMLRARDGPFVDAYRELHPNRCVCCRDRRSCSSVGVQRVSSPCAVHTPCHGETYHTFPCSLL